MSAVALSSTALPVRRGAVAKCTAARSVFVGRCIALPLAPVRALSFLVCYACEGGALWGPLMMGIKGCAACCVAAALARCRRCVALLNLKLWKFCLPLQAVRAARSLVVKATYETEKTEVDVDQIVKDLQTKVRVAVFRLQLAALLPFSPWDGLARPLTASDWVASGTVWRTRRPWQSMASARSCCCGCRPPSSQP